MSDVNSRTYDDCPSYGHCPNEIKELIAQAKTGDTDAIFGVFEYFNDEKTEEIDDTAQSSAIYWLQKAAEDNHPQAIGILGVCYADGYILEQCDDKAFELYEKAYAMGNLDVRLDLASCYANGFGVPKDAERAVQFYKELAEEGCENSWVHLAKHYYDGNGVPQDSDEAIKWYSKAAENGNIDIQKELADFYRFGRIVKQDYEKMIYWETKAAEQGDSDCMYQLAIAYRNGEIVKQNHAQAYKWFTKATEAGSRGVYKLLHTFDLEDLEPESDNNLGELKPSSVGQKYTYLSLALNSRKMRAFEAAKPATEQQQKLLAYGAILMTANAESSRTLDLWETPESAAKMLSSWWAINDSREALKTASYLSIAKGHTPYADDIYKLFIQKGGNTFTIDNLKENFKEYSMANIFRKYVKSHVGIQLSGDALPREELINALAEIYANNNAMDELLDEMEESSEVTELPETTWTNLQKAMLSQIINTIKQDFIDTMYENIVADINESIKAYLTACVILKDLGYTDEELASVPSTAAWDYGRVAFIVRYSVKAGYMEEDLAWRFLQTTAKNASQVYSSWRQYMAGYVMGRALGYKNDSKDFHNSRLPYLLNDPHSPFNEIAF